MCTTIYGSKRDYREDMRRPFGSARAHAMCRLLTGTATQASLWYGAHYWAGCAVTTSDENLYDNLTRYKTRFFYEVTGGNGEPNAGHRALWELAIKRMMKLRSEALNLKTSVLW